MVKESKNSNPPSFEVAMADLEELVAKIETGNLSLEDSLKEFEQGIKLSRICQQALTDAEQRVKILTDSLNGEAEEDFQISE
jgi:exodeoxyribonuclease VII small subunit